MWGFFVFNHDFLKPVVLSKRRVDSTESNQRIPHKASNQPFCNHDRITKQPNQSNQRHPNRSADICNPGNERTPQPKKETIMKKSSICLFGGALIGAGLGSPAAADVTISDSLEMIDLAYGYDSGSFAYADGYVEIDTFDFTVNTSGTIVLDLLSMNHFDTFFDGAIMLFSNDGNPLTAANLLTENDDWAYADTNGSPTTLDSYISTFLTAGEYTVAVRSYNYFFDISEIEAYGNTFGTIFSLDGLGVPESGEYQLDILGDVTVPAPSALALLGLGGLTAARRRRDQAQPRRTTNRRTR